MNLNPTLTGSWRAVTLRIAASVHVPLASPVLPQLALDFTAADCSTCGDSREVDCEGCVFGCGDCTDGVVDCPDCLEG